MPKEEQKLYLKMARKIKINTESTYQYLQVFNGILELTDKEMTVLSLFLDLGVTVNLCSAENKKLVADSMKIADSNTLNIYVKRLKDKGAIKKTKNGYQLAPILKRDDAVIIEIR